MKEERKKEERDIFLFTFKQSASRRLRKPECDVGVVIIKKSSNATIYKIKNATRERPHPSVGKVPPHSVC